MRRAKQGAAGPFLAKIRAIQVYGVDYLRNRLFINIITAIKPTSNVPPPYPLPHFNNPNRRYVGEGMARVRRG